MGAWESFGFRGCPKNGAPVPCIWMGSLKSGWCGCLDPKIWMSTKGSGSRSTSHTHIFCETDQRWPTLQFEHLWMMDFLGSVGRPEWVRPGAFPCPQFDLRKLTLVAPVMAMILNEKRSPTYLVAPIPNDVHQRARRKGTYPRAGFWGSRPRAWLKARHAYVFL